MLISRAGEANPNERKRERAAEHRAYDHTHEYQTANELFEIMAKNHPFDCSVADSLSASDLVILYKNIEMGTKLMSDAEELKGRKPNQYVETIVYNDEAESDESDSGDVYTTEDIQNAVLVNNERMDFLNLTNPPSLENTLCQKFGDLKMQNSNISTQYNKHFLFKDPYIKEQLENLSILKNSSDQFDSAIFPASLLDYICCKRLEDNYNFYMDNVIKYVKHTIEQLKRISNGDYLTDKAKEKWREVESATINRDINAKILATSVSIPLQVQRKANGHPSTWDDIIHSEVDIRSLSKILEKKIVVEIPKLIRGSYKLFSKLCSDNLIFSCKKEHQPKKTAEKEKSRLDVVFKLGRSETGQVMSNINTIMVWQTNPCHRRDGSTATTLLPLGYRESPKEKIEEQPPKIIEIEAKEESIQTFGEIQDSSHEINNNLSTENNNSFLSFEDNYRNEDKSNIFSESSDSLKEILDTKVVTSVLQNETPFHFVSPDDLSYSIQNSIMSSLPEESYEEVQKSIKRKSPTKVRVKSPYENKSYLIEEKKRKKLLEIRERREKKKIAMSESCKITKHRYGKGSIMPRPSSSVTKLSITNKSFYNSIYGQNAKDNDKLTNKCKTSKEKKDLTIDTPLEQLGNVQAPEMLTPDINNKKYINRSYYLDDAVTEIMYTETSDCSSDVRELFSTSTSLLSNDLGPNQAMHSTILCSPRSKLERFDENKEIAEIPENESQSILSSLQNEPDDGPSLSSENEKICKNDTKKTIPIECRRSIDKIYDLLKKMGNADTSECKSSQSKCMTVDTNKIDATVGQENSIQCSDSGTSLKHILVSSNPSSFSFDKLHTTDYVSTMKSVNRKSNDLTTVVPKVIISTKQQGTKFEHDKFKKERKKVSLNPLRVPENPLKAISQLLHEFDSVQKTRQKLNTDSKATKRPEVSFENRHMSRISPTKNRSRSDSYDVSKDEHFNDKSKFLVQKERRVKPFFGSEPLKGSYHAPNEERYIDHTSRKKLADIIDEVKEAKGEAVRGPSKFTSRLNTLAQPKKSYVQAHSEEYQTKYGRTLLTDRLQRLAGASGERVGAGPRARFKRTPEPVPAPPARHQLPSLPPLAERGAKHRRPASANTEKPAPPDLPSYKQNHVPDAPETHLKNKMVAVESYVKNHYRRTLPGGAGEEQPRGAAKSRVPLIPHDLDLSPMSSSPTGDESGVLGNKLHRIVNSIIRSKPAVLSALAEGPETGSKHSQDEQFDDEEYHCRNENPSSCDSDYRADIFEDKHVKTAVQNFLEAKQEESVTDETSESNAFKCEDMETFKSATEIQELENALYHRISVGAFSKRLRIKKLTITPKQSMQQVFLLQSGDAAGSLVLHSTISKSMKLNISKANSEKDIYALQSLMKSPIDWNVSNIPIQITTVGYAFPQYNTTQCGSNTASKSLQDILRTGNRNSAEDQAFIDTANIKVLSETDFTQDMHSHENNSMTYRIKKNTEHMSPSKEQPVTIPAISESAVTRETNDELIEMTKPLNKSISNIHNLNVEANMELINQTSSLDILVGLLNEIQKITACHITNTENCTDYQECKRLETMLISNKAQNCAVEYNESRELISITSLDRLRHLDSNPSIYSLYISNDESESVDVKFVSNVNPKALSVMLPGKINFADKEVSAEFPKPKFTSTLTDVPSLIPIAVTHSTNVTDSLLGMLSKPSNQTIFSINDYETTYSDSSFYCQNKIKEISQPTATEVVIKQLPVKFEGVTKVSDMKCVVGKEITNVNDTKHHETAIVPFNTKTRLLKNTCVTDSDPLLKMKRDILVTVYSMLVLTVFAALSFPDLLCVKQTLYL